MKSRKGQSMVVSSLRLTLSELPLVETEVLRPCLVWFPTGPSYDRHLTKALPGFKTEDLDYPGILRPTDWKNFWLR
jgi:hypothetical protein